MRLQFDRGTIVLADPPKDLDLAEAPGVLWDARVRAHRAPASKYPALKLWLHQHGAGFQDIRPPSPPVQELWSNVDLRPYQDAAMAAWELGHRRGVVALPTGSGKTRLALAAMQRTRLSAVCLVPTRVLLDQWLREIGALYRGPVGCCGDGVRRWAPLTVATYESAYRHMDQLGDRVDLVIVDEVHHFGCGLRDETLEMTTAEARPVSRRHPHATPRWRPASPSSWDRPSLSSASRISPEAFLRASIRSRCMWISTPTNAPSTRGWPEYSPPPMRTSAGWRRPEPGRTLLAMRLAPQRDVGPVSRGARCDGSSPSYAPSVEHWHPFWTATGNPAC